MSTNQSNNLRPCPFCGGNSWWVERNFDSTTLYCTGNCGCHVHEDFVNDRPIEDALTKRIAKLEAERRWIPVSERLPEANKCVLVYDAGGNMTVDFLVTSGEVEKYFWLAKYRILFWMPLPESPNDTQTQTFVYGKESKEESER